VPAGGRQTVSLTLTARDDLDWGEKTVVFDVEVAGRHSYFWRTLTVQRLPKLAVRPGVIEAGSKRVSVRSAPFPWAKTATAEAVRLEAFGGQAAVGSIGDGRSVATALPAPAQSGAGPGLQRAEAKLHYTIHGRPTETDVSVDVATCPTSYPRPTGAIGPLVVANPHDEYLERRVVSMKVGADLPQDGPLYVREAGGNVVPSQLCDGELKWVAMLPPRSTTVYYLCKGEAPQPPTDLRVSTGPDGLTVENGRFSLGWDGTRGGTLTRFVSRKTGCDYAAGSLGVGFGSWGEFDPEHPAINTIDFVSQEDKVWQRDAGPGAEVKVLRQGPVSVEVQVTGRVDNARYEQRYTIEAYQDAFQVSSRVTTEERAPELVALDARFFRNDLEKIFPNFTGLGPEMAQDQPTGGWREAPYVPPYATMMTPPGYGESISLIGGIDAPPAAAKFRQGFWPARRPKAGPVVYAQAEYIARDSTTASASAWVLLHEGYQVVAKQYRQTRVEEPPTVIRPTRVEWAGDLEAAASAPDWWDPHWHYALPVTVVDVPAGTADPTVALSVDFAKLLGEGALDPASPRAVVGEGFTARLLPTTYDAAAGRVLVSLSDDAWPAPAPREREFTLYFDTRSHGEKRPSGPALSGAPTVLNGSFEDGEAHWSLPEATLQQSGGHAGQGCIRLEWQQGMGPTLAANGSMLVRPGTQYRLVFWAKTDTPGARVMSNYYINGDYDFPQDGTALTADGQWHRYEVVRPVGQFPPTMRPLLRLWLLGAPQVVWIDDVSSEPLGETAPAEAKVQFGDLRTGG